MGRCRIHRATGRYADGLKRCSVCEVFMVWDGARCPCCNYTLRTRSRDKSAHKIANKPAGLLPVIAYAQ